jgi:hypothetical protein
MYEDECQREALVLNGRPTFVDWEHICLIATVPAGCGVPNG